MNKEVFAPLFENCSRGINKEGPYANVPQRSTQSHQHTPLLNAKALRGPHFGPVSLTLGPNEFIVVTGPSGSGKSLLLRALADLDPNQGDVSLVGKVRESYSPMQWRKQVGLLPAESHWWAERVRDHFVEQPTWQLTTLGLDKDVLDWSVSRLSSGERERLALLRLLQNRPCVLLVDEPTANLDSENTQRIETLLKDYTAENNAGVIWVSHDKSQIERIADRVLTLGDGAIQNAN